MPVSPSSAPLQSRSAWAAAGPSALTHRPPTPRRIAAATGRLPGRGQCIGLLGGSFNPAHGGHLAISEEALRRLDVDAVWWLVSPQNPIKARDDMAPLASRIASAQAVAGNHPRVRVTTVESVLGTRRTLATLTALRRRFPSVTFLWLMGADNLLGISRWGRWAEIFKTVPIAVFNRPTYTARVGRTKAARRFAHARLPERSAPVLRRQRPPAWVFFQQPQDPRSATAIRNCRTSSAHEPMRPNRVGVTSAG